VVGKSGEEIWVDKYGRVVVQFYWDRVGKDNEKSSCWVRVSQPWAGKNWGAMWIPRIGQEVIVSFLEGDPDRPLITGRVYNAEQTVPYDLPDHQTVSTFKSRSSKGGGSDNFNEIRFEDKKGSEQIFINAEKDMDLRVENDSREFVGANRNLIVKTNQQEKVEGDKSLHVVGNHLEKIDADMSLQVGGDQSEKVGGGYSLQVGGSIDEKVGSKRATEAGQEIHLKAGMKVIIEAGVQVSLKGPGGFVDVGPAGVTIQGAMVLINSGGSAGSGSGASPKHPKDPKDPDQADDGSKFTKM
jgi:type VI secretion system secreted protein VgrG